MPADAADEASARGSRATTCYLLRHAESAFSDRVAEAERPLTDRGYGQACDLVPALSGLDIGLVFSSPYRRALETVAQFARHAGLPVKVVPDLRERPLSSAPVKDWLEVVRSYWADFGWALAGGESSAACQRRFEAALEGIVASADGRAVLVSSHGNAIGLFLNRISPAFGFEEWRAMETPALYRVIASGGGFRLDGIVACSRVTGGAPHERTR